MNERSLPRQTESVKLHGLTPLDAGLGRVFEIMHKPEEENMEPSVVRFTWEFFDTIYILETTYYPRVKAAYFTFPCDEQPAFCDPPVIISPIPDETIAHLIEEEIEAFQEQGLWFELAEEAADSGDWAAHLMMERRG